MNEHRKKIKKICEFFGNMTEGVVEVLAEDQVRMNRYSRLNTRAKELTEELSQLRAKVRTCEDAQEELALVLEEGGIMLALGEAFFPIHEDQAEAKIAQAKNLAEQLRQTREKEAQEISGEMEVLKKTLYSKFGASINLDDN
jgi:prefoldin subunit 4